MSEEEVRAAAPEFLALAAVARQLAELGRLDDARTLLEGLVILEPANAYLHTCLGCVYMRLGRAEDALAAFDEALRHDASDIVAHTYSGELKLQSGQLEPAFEHFDHATAGDAEGMDPHANRARTLSLIAERIRAEARGKPPEAVRELVQKALTTETEGGSS